MTGIRNPVKQICQQGDLNLDLPKRLLGASPADTDIWSEVGPAVLSTNIKPKFGIDYFFYLEVEGY